MSCRKGDSMTHPSIQETGFLPQALTRSRRHVYFIESHPSLALQFGALLEPYLYPLTTYRSPEELPALPGATLAVVIDLDSLLPLATSGVQAIRRMALVGIPLIFLSTRDDLATRLEAIRLGGEAFFTKPIDFSALLDTLGSFEGCNDPDPYRVLIVEDSALAAGRYAQALQDAGMKTRISLDASDLMRALIDFNPDLLLMDLYLSACSGQELAKAIRQQARFAGVPIVFLSTETDVSKQLIALSSGGDDFLTKPIDPIHLVSSVSNRAQRARSLQSLMACDSLTGLLNHTKIKEQLDRELRRASREGSPVAFAMIDLDHFKIINDTHGHPTGDRVIKGIATFLKRYLRKSDSIGRYGGEEFAVILPNTQGPHALVVLNKLREQFSSLHYPSEEGPTFSVSFSAGIATSPEFDAPLTLTQAADKALYAAKLGGRNQVVLSVGNL